MAEPTLAEIFGAGAVQDENTLTIQKAALVGVGLTANAANRAEALFAALFRLAANKLNPTNQETDADIQIAIDFDNAFESLVTAGTTQYRQLSVTCALRKPDAGATFEPDDY